MQKNKNEAGFIPMLILIGILLLVVVWFAYKHVSGANKNKIEKVKNTYEHSLSR